MKIRNIAVFASAIVLAGCSAAHLDTLNSPFSPAWTLQDLSKKPNQTLCEEAYKVLKYPESTKWGFGTPHKSGVWKAYRELLHAKRLIRKSDFANVKQGKLRIGMNECIVIATWGKPNDINRTNTATGVDLQWVYNETKTIGTYPYSSIISLPSKFAYFTNGKLTSWQD